MAESAVQMDEDEWHDFNRLKCLTGQEIHMQRVNLKPEDVSDMLDGCLDTGLNISYTSAEEIVNHFDEKLQFCFQNQDFKPDTIDRVKTISEDRTLKCDEIWNALMDSYSNVMPVDWNHSRACSLHLSTLSLEDKPRLENLNLDLSDDEDLREQMDMHSIVVSCINEEPLLTAEQVIEEIEEIMHDSSEMESEQNTSLSEFSVISHKTQRSHTNHVYKERARLMSVAELNEWLEEVEMTILGYSEELIQHLAMRDELEFEKEVKNSFISVLIDVQNRQKEHREMLKKKKKVKNTAGTPNSRLERLHSSRFSMEGISTAIQNGFRQTFGNGGEAKQYVTTVIPYERKDRPPPVQDLQIFIKLLEAMRDDSDKVPSLLTDYILKVLCPT
ncbi:fasciculation and elongation protein zeta-2 isoform X1 [Triplophysa dalaica]|uniref:fasciculation and elongation protein zeta-2 isoform X1 n=1 Tax=Triplophysa dalaica TaxID=1582913 RepID=UPI0024E00B2A|nr:fasciculation and elongation protein zeta-2 isoform X1 [Triplophysa dalaica]